MASVIQEQVGTQSDLPLSSFGVRGFRALKELRIPALARVNLFVGRNNAGKTSLLEAIHLYAGGATSSSLRQLLVSRDEVANARDGVRPDAESLDGALKRLFHADGQAVETCVALGPLNDAARTITIRRGWAAVDGVEDGRVARFSPVHVPESLAEQERALEVQLGNKTRTIPDSRLFGRFSIGEALQFLYPALTVPANGLSTDDIGYAWDRIALTDEEDIVTGALRIMAPEVERISLVGDVDGPNDRRVMVRVRGQAGPLPLRTMGDGMNRLLGITLALAVVSGGILLVDEIENGIHYSVQTDVWRTILRAAESLNVQVFATTHSWDCIRAFAAATNEMEGTAGILYRLDRRIKGEVRPVRYTQEEMAIAAEQQIEVR
jgi:stage V sporulation protein SpoVS